MNNGLAKLFVCIQSLGWLVNFHQFLNANWAYLAAADFCPPTLPYPLSQIYFPHLADVPGGLDRS